MGYPQPLAGIQAQSHRNVVLFAFVANPDDENGDDEFSEMHDPFIGAPLSGHLVVAFGELYNSFSALMESGFTENQALKFLAFCSIFEGDF